MKEELSIHEFGVGNYDELTAQGDLDPEKFTAQEPEAQYTGEPIVRTGIFYEPAEDFLK